MENAPANLPKADKWRLLAGICRESFEEFCKHFWETIPGVGRLVWNWHLSVICKEQQEAAERVFRLLPRHHDTVYNLPFGSSKSSILSVLFLPWTWTRAPWTKHLKATHTDLLVLDLANKCREVIKSEKFQLCYPEIKLKETNDSKGYFMNTDGGCCFTCTAAGKSPLGLHAHFLGLDDIIDPKKMLSEAEIKSAREFITNIVPTRKDNKAVAYTYLVMQRLGIGDPTDVMIAESKKEGAAKVRHFVIPGEIKTVPDGEAEVLVKPRGLRQFYSADGLLDPVRLPWSVLREYQARGALFYSTQILQRPYTAGGGMFKLSYFTKRLKAAPYDAVRVRSWDRAATEGAGCNTAGTLMARDKDGHWYVEHVVVGQWEPKERDDIMLATAQRDRDRYGPNYEPAIVIEHEPGSSGVDAFQHTAAKLAGFSVYPNRPTGDKVTRAEPWSAQCAAGNVYLVDDGTWDIDAWVQEHCSFPGGLLKDRVDSATQGFIWLCASHRRGASSFRVLPVRSVGMQGKGKGLRIMPLSFKDLAGVGVEERALLVVVRSPAHPTDGDELENTFLVRCNNPAALDRIVQTFGAVLEQSDPHLGVYWVSPNGCHRVVCMGKNRDFVKFAIKNQGYAEIVESESAVSDLPPHGINKLVGHVVVEFADIDPAEVQESWHDVDQQMGRLPSTLVMKPDHGKAIWRVVTRRQEPPWQTIVVVGEGRVPMSVACALCDVLRFKRQEVVWTPFLTASDKLEPANKHVYETMKKARHLVM